LVTKICFNSILVDTDCGDKVSSTPETTLGNLFVFLLEPRAGFGLDESDSIRDRILRWNNEIQVDMFIADMPGSNPEVFPVAN
jgi:hypothetical protein